MADPTPGTAPQPYLAVADATGWPDLPGLPRVTIDAAVVRLRSAAAAGRPVQVVLYRPTPAAGAPAGGASAGEVGRNVRGLWAADPRVQIVLALPDVDGCWDAVRQHLRPGDALVPVPADAVTGPAVAQLADALSAKWAAAANAAATLAEVDRRVADRTADLHRLALHDRLTGLGNRALLNERLTDLIAAAADDAGRTFAVLFLDFDRFKIVNDSLGHEVGDGLLVAIADRLRRTLRDSDTVSTGTADADAAAHEPMQSTAARLGGDEFILLLDHLREPADAARVAERVLANLAAPYRIRGHTIHSTASIGITTSGVGYTAAGDMLRDADTAMYRAKAAGKARYVLFDTHMHAEAVDRLTLESDLREALDRGQFALEYQPIRRLGDGGTVALEALLRWHHPTRGTVPPATFVPLAEEIGGMVAIGDWVIDAACRQLADWRARHPGPFAAVAVHLNLSRRQLISPGFVARLAAALAAHGLPPSAVHLEFTERAVADDPATALAVLDQLRAMDVELHLDNFGTGQSSLSCLRRFPLSGLKLGPGFTHDALTRPADRTVLAAVVGLARDLDLHLVAEGIETPEQVDLLRQLGCDRAQGYHVARPLAPPAAEAFVVGGG